MHRLRNRVSLRDFVGVSEQRHPYRVRPHKCSCILKKLQLKIWIFNGVCSKGCPIESNFVKRCLTSTQPAAEVLFVPGLSIGIPFFNKDVIWWHINRLSLHETCRVAPRFPSTEVVNISASIVMAYMLNSQCLDRHVLLDTSSILRRCSHSTH